MKNAIVIKDHQSEYTTSFLVKAGALLIAEEKESEWEGWVWCKTPDNLYRWYPQGYIKEIPGKPSQFELIRDYNPKELPVRAGQKITIHFEESEWAWVETCSDEEGWVPLDNIKVLD